MVVHWWSTANLKSLMPLSGLSQANFNRDPDFRFGIGIGHGIDVTVAVLNPQKEA